MVKRPANLRDRVNAGLQESQKNIEKPSLMRLDKLHLKDKTI